MRRTPILPGSVDSFTLKLGHASPVPVSEDSILIVRPSRLAPSRGLEIGAQFNLAVGVELSATIMLDGWRRLPTSAGSFRVWLVDLATWALTLVGDFAGVSEGGLITAEVSEPSLGVQLDGQVVLAVEAKATLYGREVKRFVYANDLGVFEHADRLRLALNRIEARAPSYLVGRVS